MTRIVITGVGCVSALGRGKAQSWAALRSGQSRLAMTKVTATDPTLFTEAPVGAARDEDCVAPEKMIDPKIFKLLDRFCKLAIIATAEAIAECGLLEAAYDPADIAVIFGSSTGGLTSLEESYYRVYAQRTSRLHPMTVPRFMSSSPASAISLAFGITGPAWCLSSACASSAHAIAEAVHLIKSGRAKAAIAGGAEASLTHGHLMAWQSLGAVAKDTCRPFSIDRTGMALGEGAATLVLEDYDAARRRGAPIYAEITGSGASSDAYHITQPKADGAAAAMRQALRESGLSAERRLLISTHGTGTPLNDISEAVALRLVLGDDLSRHVAIATKSAHGHLLGGTGALEFLLGVLALKEGLAPPVCNFTAPDPECPLPLALEEPQPLRDAALLSNSFAFGGLNSVLIAIPA
jgi:nodulation protein E